MEDESYPSFVIPCLVGMSQLHDSFTVFTYLTTYIIYSHFKYMLQVMGYSLFLGTLIKASFRLVRALFAPSTRTTELQAL